MWDVTSCSQTHDLYGCIFQEICMSLMAHICFNSVQLHSFLLTAVAPPLLRVWTLDVGEWKSLLRWINGVDPFKYTFNKLEMQSWGTQKRYLFHLVDIERTLRCLFTCIGALLPWEIHESRVNTIHNRTLIMNRANTLDWRLYLAFSLSMNLCFQWWKAERWHYKCFLNG